eukprot:scaffold37854_cov61-Phaeocystis_antarctica.AAC.3
MDAQHCEHRHLMQSISSERPEATVNTMHKTTATAINTPKPAFTPAKTAAKKYAGKLNTSESASATSRSRNESRQRIPAAMGG